MSFDTSIENVGKSVLFEAWVLVVTTMSSNVFMSTLRSCRGSIRLRATRRPKFRSIFDGLSRPRPKPKVTAKDWPLLRSTRSPDADDVDSGGSDGVICRINEAQDGSPAGRDV